MQIPDELIEAFTTAVATTLREMTGVEVVVRGTSSAAGGEGPSDGSAVLRLIAETEGWLILSVPQGTAAALAGRVLTGMAVDLDEEMTRDCVRELANVIAGQAKALLLGTPHHFILTTPTAGGPGAPAVGVGWLFIRFATDAGEFTLYLRPPHETSGAVNGWSRITEPGG